MTTPAPDIRVQPVRAAIDSTVMLVLARFAMPTVIAALGWFITGAMDDLKRTNQQVWVQLAKLGDAQAMANAAQTGLAVKVDGAVKQLDHLQQQVDSLPRR